MSTFIAINVLFHFSNMGSGHFKIVIIFLINIAIMSVIRSQFTNFSFANTYVNLMSLIAIISLICFGLAVFSPETATKLVTSFGNGVDNKYFLSPFYMWGWGRIATRNAGPFWEPGAFQAFIVIAVLMILLVLLPNTKSKAKMNRLKIQFFIFCVTILTTQSTTAYLLFILLSAVFIKDVKRLFLYNAPKKSQLLKGFVVFVLVFAGIYYVISSNNIENKLAGRGNEYSSVEIRMNDTIESVKLIGEGGAFGLGKTYYTKVMEQQRGVINNSNGLLNLIYTYGIFFAVAYIGFYKKGIDSFFSIKNSKKKYFLYLIFIVFHFTEGLYWLSFFLFFLFESKKHKY